MDNKSLLFTSSFVALFIIFCLPFTISQEVDDEREFSYDEQSPIGPQHWGGTCNEGDMQSPIDLLDERVQNTSKLGRLDTDYKPANATLINTGHDMKLRWIEGAGHIYINETEYQLNQLHWHTPTEHAINGRRFNLELHMVHESTDEKIAVVGILYEIGHPDCFLSMLEPYLKALAPTRDVEKTVGIIDPRDINIGSGESYYRYMGSLTTPPCTENVTWTIVRKVRTVSHEQLRIFREALDDEANGNARPLQAFNDRWLKLYIPDEQTKGLDQLD